MVIPIATIHLFPTLDKELITTLRSLADEDWNKPTLAKQWSVKDIAAHLLDGNLRALSLLRDKQALAPATAIENYSDLVRYLNELNAQWVTAFRRISPEVLIHLLETSGVEYIDYLSSLDPFAASAFPVAWAGETVSLNWFHIAREYTEKFHHQQQIREATGMNGLYTPELYQPFIATFLKGLPYLYRNTEAPEGTSLSIIISGNAGGSWYLQKEQEWQLVTQPAYPLSASITIPQEIAWKLFTRGVSPQEVAGQVIIEGNNDLALHTLNLVAVMA